MIALKGDLKDMNASLHNNEIRFALLAEALRQEVQDEPTDATKSIRVRHGIYSLRGQVGRYIVRNQKFYHQTTG